MKLEASHRIEQRLEFVRPFKTVCSVFWELEDKAGQTEVTWTMRGKMPFFFRFMTNTTKQMIAKDYDLGLAMLRGKLDPNADKPVLDFEGEVALEPQRALTIPFKGGVKEMVTAMTEGYQKLTKHVEMSGKTLSGRPFVAYHKVNPKTMYFECDMAVPVDAETPQGDFQQKTLGGGKYFKVTLQGSYDFLEVAWYSAMSHIRMQKMKYDKSRPSLEIYENDCESVEHSNEIITGLYIPVR